MSGFKLPLRFALPCSFLHTWRGWWRGYPAFHVATGVTSSSSSKESTSSENTDAGAFKQNTRSTTSIISAQHHDVEAAG
jgi:hypothetical protein